MKWYHTLTFKISIIFLVAFVGLGAMGFIFIAHDINEEGEHIERYARFTLRSAYDQHTQSLDMALLEQEGFELINDPEFTETLFKVKKRQERIFSFDRSKKLDRSSMRKRRFIPIRIVHFKGDFYALLTPNHKAAIAIKTPFESKNQGKFILFVLLTGLLVVLYFLTLRSIRPLKPLKENIEALAQGNYDIRCNSKGKDEIAAVANAFDTTVQKIKHLRDARQLFLRNIMHELKTPIMKGKLSTEMIEESSYRQKLVNVFNRQEHLLEEFSRIEKLSAGEITLNRENYALEDLMAQVLDILDDKVEQINIALTPYSLHVDFDLFSTALKNLIDNGVNYSSNHQVSVTLKDHILSISNQGDALEYPLERYKEPYFLEGKKQQESRGLGFGLFIALHIFTLHHCLVTYEHKEGVSCFKIDLNPQEF